ncbi:YsnF/AvaK domain-containing protein [Pantoea sp. WMus005]|uniref:YsnF/AvaK domain-containing protein n=1 Tax=Pantoea sp. WMus005 TaxID=2750734 RepID=UPI0015CFC48D|nr:YsnF/AvaK domain-containing protein [Pantoea sp. WMus005]NYS30422.1 YsnF/AvaK domain-containing protein [Pantoea sp. WMus005]
MAQEKIVTLFDSAIQAEAAKRNLVKAGFSDRDISLISGERLQQEGQSIRHPSLWQRLFGHDVDKDEADVYTKAMDKGGVVLTIRTEEEKLARAMTILHSHDSVDVPSRMQSSVNNGNTAPGINPTAGKQFAGETNDRPAEPLRTSLTGDESEADILRLAEEQVEVGKRLVSEGSTRVRRYTVTDTVSEDISLHEQHADIFRRSVNEPALAGEVDWSEKTVEVAETHEQPVINKTTHVKEEVVVRTDGSDRTETINDTVRRQEVDIDHARSGLERELPGTTAAGRPAAAGAATQSPGAHNRDHKESLTEKVSEKASEVKDKVESKLHDHSH